MVKILLKLSLLFSFILTLLPPGPAYAQWPPFDFSMTPVYQSGKIKYSIKFKSDLEGVMTNVTFKIQLPDGTRFVEAAGQQDLSASFDGTEVIFLIPQLNQPIKDATFVVEITDPTLTVFTTNAWIGWEGEQSGNFLTRDVAVDITRQPLDWDAPFKSNLQLEARAIAADGIVTYLFYPKNTNSSRIRMQDLKINVPVPEGATFLSAEAPPSFSATFDGREVSFFKLELEQGVEEGPLTFKVSTDGVTTPTLATHAWAIWKNAGRRVGVNRAAQEEINSGDLVVQPEGGQWVAADPIGDVPFRSYDLTSLAFEAYPTALKASFITAEDIGPPGAPLEFILFVDGDCNTATGSAVARLGADYRVRYIFDTGKTRLDAWTTDQAEPGWARGGSVSLVRSENSRMISLWIPDESLPLADKTKFCWSAQVKNDSTAYSPAPPTDSLIPARQDLQLTLSSAAPPVLAVPAPKVTATKVITGSFIEVGDTWEYFPGWAEPAAAWKTQDFEAKNWFSGPTPLGYGVGKYRTNLEQVILPVGKGINLPDKIESKSDEYILSIPPTGDKGSVFMRHIFEVSDLEQITQLALKIKYEGGFVAYLNGVEVARRNLGEDGSPAPFTLPAELSESRATENIDLTSYIPQLTAGDNLLAVQGHRAFDNSNLLLSPRLTWRSRVAAPQPAVDDTETAAPEPAAPSAPLPLPEMTGKLAVPVDNGFGFYDVYVFSIPDGEENVKIPYARQPQFRFDGQRLLINREGGGADNLFEYNMADGTQRAVSDAPKDSHPTYDSDGNRVAYGNPELTYGQPERVYNEEDEKYYFTGVAKPFIFVQCGIKPPHEETEPRCRDIPNLGVLVPAGQMGEIQGTNPVWTSSDMIAYKGCNTWSDSGLCGIYLVPSASTKGFSNGFIPRQLTRDTSDIPSDSKGNLIAFTSRRDGNWEAYAMDLNGNGVRNLSNNPDSNDGLPSLSPDGSWVAFVSNRGGQWAVWAVPAAGGEAEKLFDLPTNAPWGTGDRDWINERISWGP